MGPGARLWFLVRRSVIPVEMKNGVVRSTPFRDSPMSEVDYSSPFQAPKLAPDSIHFLIRA